jgi:hypothetical protein
VDAAPFADSIADSGEIEPVNEWLDAGMFSLDALPNGQIFWQLSKLLLWL